MSRKIKINFRLLFRLRLDVYWIWQLNFEFVTGSFHHGANTPLLEAGWFLNKPLHFPMTLNLTAVLFISYAISDTHQKDITSKAHQNLRVLPYVYLVNGTRVLSAAPKKR